jgi:hypothetical protein
MASVITEGTGEGLVPEERPLLRQDRHRGGRSRPGLYNNSWFVVFNDVHDLALCALSIRGSYGATTAGPECAQVFKKLFPADF